MPSKLRALKLGLLASLGVSGMRDPISRRCIMRSIPRWTTTLFAVVLAGCDGGSTTDTMAKSSGAETMLGQESGPVVQSATGAGHFTIAGELRTFSFTALKYADGTVQGQYELFNRANGARIHGDVVCLSVVGNLAWVGGRQKLSSGGFPDGLENGFRVADNGEGATDPPDQLSLMFVNAPPGFAQAYCDVRPEAPPLNPIEHGNIQVRS